MLFINGPMIGVVGFFLAVWSVVILQAGSATERKKELVNFLVLVVFIAVWVTLICLLAVGVGDNKAAVSCPGSIGC